MNKILVGVVSSLATLGLVGGAGAIALSSPEIKDNLSISFGTNDILGNTVSTGMKRFEELSNEIVQTNILLAQEKEKVVILTNQVENFKQEELKYKVEIANLNGDNANLTSEIATLNNDLNIANNKVTTLENRVSSYQSQISSLRNTNTQLNNSLSTLQTENSVLESNISTLTNELAICTSELESLQEDYDNNVTRIEELENTITLKEQNISALQNEKNSLQMSIYDLQSDIDSNNQYIATLSRQIEEKNVEIDGLNAEIVTLNSQILEKNNQIAINETTISNLTEQLTTLQSQLDAKNEELALSQESISQFSALISELQVEVDECKNKIDMYESALQNHVIINYNIQSTDNYILQDKESGILAENPTLDGHIFSGWSLTENGKVIDNETTFSEDTTLYAVFLKEPTLDDFYMKRKLPNGDYFCSDANQTSGAYNGVWYYSSADKKARQIYPNGLMWDIHQIDEDRFVFSDDSYSQETFYYSFSEDKVIVVDIDAGYMFVHCTKDNALILSNYSKNTIFDLNTEQMISKKNNYNYTLDTYLDLPSGDCLLGGDNFSSSLYIYRTNTKTIEELYKSGMRWKYMALFDSGVALAGNQNLTGILKYDDNTKQTKLIEIADISGITGIQIVNSKYAMILAGTRYFRYCIEDDSIEEIFFETRVEFWMGVLVSENEMVFTGKQNYCGIYLYNAEENTLTMLYNPNYNYAVYSKYSVYDNGNILFQDSSGNNKAVYIASTKTAEAYNKNIDYNTYTGANNE